MKVIALTLTTLYLAVLIQANRDYTLKCTREEVGIRWPSYYSNSEYYVCQREGGKQLVTYCPPGELFTFVLQSCTPANRFIPPPPLSILPTSPPVVDAPRPIKDNHSYFPKPINKPHNEDNLRPPVIISQQPPIPEGPVPIPPVLIDEPHSPEHPVVELPEEEGADPSNKPGKPLLPGKPKPQIPSLPTKVGKPDAPIPPTPAPTPPVVADGPKKKQPPSLPGVGKKQPPKIPGEDKNLPSKPAGKKQPPVPTGKKQPPVPSGKKQPPVPSGKKQPPVPTGKKQPPIPSGKSQQAGKKQPPKPVGKKLVPQKA